MRKLQAVFRFAAASGIFLFLLLFGCDRQNKLNQESQPISNISSIPAARLLFRYEADVPQPQLPAEPASDQRDPRVVADFDQNRPLDELDRTLASPDGRRILAIYHRSGDAPGEFRLDMYSGDGKLLRPVTPDNLAVHFHEIIRWSPDASAVAFVGTLRETSTAPAPTPPIVSPEPPVSENAESPEPTAAASPTPVLPPVMAFRTEQIYLCNQDGDDLRPLTRNEGFIYFYFTWSPNSKMLAAMAVHRREWDEPERRADTAGMLLTPLGRPRIIELNGRERRLDDGLTAVRPVWSPDSSKVAIAFDTQLRIYDAEGDNPTQAAIPLRNELLLSSKAYDDAQAAQLGAANANETAPAATPEPTSLPDPASLVSFNPIVQVEWTAPDTIYFETAFVKQMKNAADSVTSFARWHRIILSPPPAS